MLNQLPTIPKMDVLQPTTLHLLKLYQPKDMLHSSLRIHSMVVAPLTIPRMYMNPATPKDLVLPEPHPLQEHPDGEMIEIQTVKPIVVVIVRIFHRIQSWLTEIEQLPIAIVLQSSSGVLFSYVCEVFPGIISWVLLDYLGQSWNQTNQGLDLGTHIARVAMKSCLEIERLDFRDQLYRGYREISAPQDFLRTKWIIHSLVPLTMAVRWIFNGKASDPYGD